MSKKTNVERRKWLRSIGYYNHVGGELLLEEREKLLKARDLRQRRIGVAMAAEKLIKQHLDILNLNSKPYNAGIASALKELRKLAGPAAMAAARRGKRE